MSCGGGADASQALYAELTRLSGPDLVAHLISTCRKADYDAVARVLGDRDRRLAHAEAAAAELRTELADLATQVQALEDRYRALKAAERRGPRPSNASSGGAVAIAAPRVDRRRGEETGPEGAIDLCGGGSSDEEDEMEEGEFRRGVAGVSCKRKESASGGDEERGAGVSCKRKAPAPACSPGDEGEDEDDEIPLSELFKKQRRADPGGNGKPKKGHGDVHANRAGPLAVDRPMVSPVNGGIPEGVAEHMIGSPDDDPKVAILVQGTGNGQSAKSGGLSRTMPTPPPTGSTAGNSLHKNGSKPDGSEGRARIGEKQGTAAGPENDAPVQVRTPRLADTVRRTAGSSRVCAETPMEHPGFSSPGTISVVAKSIEGQEKAIGGVHKTKVSLDTNGTGDKATMAMRGTTTEQGKPDDQPMEHPGSSSPGTISVVAKSIKGQEKAIGGVHKTKVSLDTNGTGDKATVAMRGTTTEQGKPDGQPMEHPGSSSQRTISVVAKSIKGQEKAIGGVHKTDKKVSLETNGTGDKATMAMRGTTTEQGKPDGQVVKTKVLPTTSGVGEQGVKLSPCRSREDTHGHGGRPTTSDKPGSATLQPQNQLALHLEQMSKESSLPSAVYNWKFSSELLASCLRNKELCMQAACALHRQRKFTTEGGRSGLSKFDVHRAVVLVEFLLDGNLQGPLKRTAEDLEKHDAAGPDLLERVVLHCSEQLFGIYSNKEDKYFR